MKQRCALVVMLLVMLSQSVRLWAASEPYARLSTDCTTLTFYDNEGKTTDDYSLPTSNAMPGWANNNATVTTVVFDKSFAAARPTTCQAWFNGMSSLTTISGIENLNTSEVTSMLNMFNGCSRLTQLNLSSFNTSKVTSMAMMFAGCEQLSSVNLTSFDTQQVTEMDMMFKGCKKLTEIDLTSFNTKNVLSTAEMFASCEQLQRIKASNHLVMTKVSYSKDMFTGCTSLQGAVAYDSEKTDAQMAQASTGYLTLVARTYVQYADGTLTFSNDANYALGFYLLPSDASEAPDWLDHTDDVTKVVFDDSFSEVRPTSCALWFRKMTHLTTIEGMENLNTSEVTNMRSMFEGCKQLTAIDLSGFVTDKVTDMRMMFNSCEQLTELDLSGFNTSAVTQMSEMFAYCASLQKLNISSFDTHAVTSMLGMFAYCASLTSLDVTGMVTDGVTDMSAMFQGCKALTSIDLTSFHTDKVTLMSEMFDGCAALETLDLTFFNTAAVTDMRAMFADCAALTRIDVSKRFVTTNVTDSYGMFTGCTSLQGAVAYDSQKTDAQMAQASTGYLTLVARTYVQYADGTLTFSNDANYALGFYLLPSDASEAPGWLDHADDVTKVVFDDSFSEVRPTSCYQWFSNMKHLATVEGLSNLNTSEVTSMSQMFSGCSALSSIDLSAISTSKVTDMSSLFSGCKSLTELDLSGWDTDNVTDMSSLFQECSALTTLNMKNWNTSNVQSMKAMFAGCSALSSLDLLSFNTAAVTDMKEMFASCSSLTTLDLTSFNTAAVKEMSGMFAGCSALTTVNVSSRFVTNGVTSSVGMFAGCTSIVGLVRFDSSKTDKSMADSSGYFTLITRPYVRFADGTLTFYDNGYYEPTCYDLPAEGEAPSWLEQAESVEKVVIDKSFSDVRPTSCYQWFCNMNHLATIEGLSNLKTSEVTSMSQMFSGCSVLSSIDLSAINTSKVTDMSSLFLGCKSLTELDLSGWDTDNVTDMSSLFQECSALTTLNMKDWNTSNVQSMKAMFAGCSTLSSLDLLSFNTGKVTDMSQMFSGCMSLDSLDLTWLDIKQVITTQSMFHGCSELRRIDVSRSFIMTSVSNSEDMFLDCTSLQGAVVYDSKKTDGSMAQWETGYLTLLTLPYVHYADSTLTFAYDTYYELSDIRVDLSVDDAPAWLTAYAVDVTKVVIDESFAQARPTSTYGWFAYMNNLKAIEGLEHLNTSKTNNMAGMFYGCKKLTQLDLSGLVTDSVTNMEVMFGGCASLQELNLSSFRTSKVTSMSGMFFYCEKLTQLDLSSFSTESVTNMESMFAECASLQELDLSGFRNTNTTDMSRLFQGCTKLSKLNLYGFRTDNVTDMRRMFMGCSSLKELDLASFYIRNVKYVDDMFSGCSELTTILVSYDFATNASIQSDDMFGGCIKLVGAVPFDSEKTDAQMANTSSGYLTMPNRAYVYKYHGTMTFYYDDDYDSSDYILPTNEHQAPGWLEYQNDIKEVTFHYSFTEAQPTSCYKWFYHMPNLTTIEGLTYLNTTCVTTMEDMFNGCRSLKRLAMRGVNTDSVESLKSLKGMFASCDSIETLDLAGLNTAAVKDMSEMFSGCSSLKRVDVSRGFVTKSVTQSGDMFQGCTQLVGAVPFDSAKTDAQMANWTTGYLTLPSRIYAQYADSTLTIYYGDDNDVTSYYTPIDLEMELPGWSNVAKDITKVVIDKSVAQARPKSTLGWFYQMIKLKDIEGLAYLNTSCVTNMMGMFLECSSIPALDLSTFQTDSVTEMALMFAECNALQKLNLSSFHTDKVKNMYGMFDECESLQELDLSSFRTDKVTLMGEMFSACSSLQELDLSSFNTEAVINMNSMFSYCEKLKRIDVSRSFVTTNCSSSQKVFMFCNELVGAVAYDSNKQLLDMVQWETGYLTLKVGTNGEDNIGAVGSPLTITNLPLSDDKAFDLYEECPTSLASYSRTVKNHWATLCLPFAFSAEGNSSARFYGVGQYDNDNISVTELSGTIAAGTPVLVYVSGNELSITAEDVDVVAQPANNTADVLQGVFTQTEVADDDYIIANDHFWNALYLKQQNPDAKHVYVAPYRAYLTLANLSEASKPNSISINDDVTDGINGIASAEGMEDLLDGAELYDLQGRRLTAPQRGVIIVRKGGVSRKVVVR